MTKLSFINNNPDDRRLTIRKLSKESTIAPLAEVLNSYTLCPDRVGFCLGPYVKPIEPPTIEIKDVNSLDGLTTLSVKINPHPDNLIEVTEEGLFVDAANLGEGGGDLYLHQTLAPVEEGLCHVVGNSHLVVPQIELVDIAGNTIGYISDIIGLPVSSQTHGPDHCPK